MAAKVRVSRRGLLAGLGAAAMAEQIGRPASGEAAERHGEPSKKKLLECLGGEWPKGGPLDAKVERTEQKDGYRLERITYRVEPEERIAAYLLVPDGLGGKRAPGICVWHQHNGAYDIGNDKVWDVWQIEGPEMVWYFRGMPHIHGYFHLAA